VTGLVRDHRVAVAQAAFVTFLWSTSWVLIKIGLEDYDLPPLTFAGLRYLLAALILLPLALPGLRAAGRATDGTARRRAIGGVIVLGVVLYAITQGAQFAALDYLPSVAVALLLSTSPVIVALIGLRGSERPSAIQFGGAIAVVVGAALYYGPLDLGPAGTLGLAIAGVGVLANAASALLGRSIARDALPAIGGVVAMTALSMLIGALVLLAVGLVIEGLPALPIEAWLIIGWLAMVNTALAFTLWNHTLRTLTAVESSVLNNLMLIQIAILAWVFLGEVLDLRQVAGLAIAFAGIMIVQLRRTSRA
jgi:drug/metabolite transporter (DMT)-like permease